jgi:aspartyl-tRNA(Asn)/glutamyl-tRNA(Gln) amidotransferase subunit A
MSDLANLTAWEASELINKKALSPVEYVRSLVDRITGLDRRVNAFLLFTPETALRAARESEDRLMAGNSLGPLDGMPFAVKDVIDINGIPTTAQSQILRGNTANADATVVSRMRAAGAISFGKLALEEFGIGSPLDSLPWPPARNPWDLQRTPGGSSSGSGAALAAGFVPFTLGTDTGGSTRCPAALCGVVGMKPTYGRIPVAGVVPLAASLDHVGVMSRTVEDNALLLHILAAASSDAPGSNLSARTFVDSLRPDLRCMRVGVIRHFYARDITASEETINAIESAVAMCGDLGAAVHEIETQPLATYRRCGETILLAEAFAFHKNWLEERGGEYGTKCRQTLLRGSAIAPADYLEALQRRDQLREELASAFRGVDVLLTAVSPAPAWHLDDSVAAETLGDFSMRIAFNMTGNPAMAIPVGFTTQGLPLSMQIIGKHNDEETVYRVGHAYQNATAWHRRQPNLESIP